MRKFHQGKIAERKKIRIQIQIRDTGRSRSLKTPSPYLTRPERVTRQSKQFQGEVKYSLNSVANSQHFSMNTQLLIKCAKTSVPDP
jgi:hypothetical protein